MCEEDLMAVDRRRVTVKLIQALAVDPTKLREPRSVLVDTTAGLALVTQSALNGVFAEGSVIRRLLLTRTDLVEDADAAGLTLSAYVWANASRIAADLNTVLDETDSASTSTASSEVEPGAPATGSTSPAMES
jgi:hypothetical protein